MIKQDQENFDRLAADAVERGYVLNRQVGQTEIWSVRSSNKVKVEIKFPSSGPEYVMGYGLDDDDLDYLNESLDLEWKKRPRRWLRAEFKDIPTFWKIVEAIEETSVEGKGNRQTTQLFPITYDPVAIAKMYRVVIETKNQTMLNNHRAMLQADSHDNAISLNKKTAENDYREHVVPCVMIHNKVVDMINIEGATDFEVAKFIDENMKIMHIPTDAANRLDGPMGLRTSMPKGWEWGDNILARVDLVA